MNEIQKIDRDDLPPTERGVAAKYRAILRRVEERPLDAEEAVANENILAALEEMARRSGLVSETAQIEIWLTRFLNRWRLGEALRKVARETHAGPGRGKRGVKTMSVGLTRFRDLLKALGLDRQTAHDIQRLAAMPWSEALKYRDMARQGPEWRTFYRAVEYARRYWQRRQRHDRVAEMGEVAALTGVYSVLYADPPWHDDFGPHDRQVELHYATMSNEQIMSLKVAGIAADDAVLFLWALPHMLPPAYAVMGAWGFTPRTNIVWVKDKIGLGKWARNKHEHLLIGRRGNFPPPPPEILPPTVIEAPRGAHSAKPKAFAELIERLYPDLPKIELFRRGHARRGWSAWGNEAREAAE